MPFTFTVETGAIVAGANSLVSTEYVDDYASARAYSSEWTALTTAQKQQVACNATRMVQEAIDWFGDRVSSTQALDWPRTGVPKRNKNEGTYVSNAIPDPLKQAIAETCIQLAKTQMIDQSPYTLNSFSVPGLSVTQANKSGGSYLISLPSVVLENIRHMGLLRSDEPTLQLNTKMW